MNGEQFPGLGKYRIVQYGVNCYMIQRKFLWFWLDASEYTSHSEERCHEILNAWMADKKVAGRVVWP